ELITENIEEFKEEDLIPKQEAVILLTHDGYIKRMLPTAFRAQERGGRGLIGFDLREEDRVAQLLLANTHDNLLFFTDRGKTFQIKAYEVPKAARISKGKLVHTFLGLSDDERITALIAYPEDKKVRERYLVMATEQGVIKKVRLEEFQNVRKSGIIAITLKSGDVLRWVRLSNTDEEVILATSNGQAIRFKEKDIRTMKRTAAGVRGIALKKGDRVISLDIIKKGSAKDAKFLVITARGYGKQTHLSNYKIQRRGGTGIKTAQVTK
ncbi:unnamed protein product, partial [marine sediment metagenome]